MAHRLGGLDARSPAAISCIAAIVSTCNRSRFMSRSNHNRVGPNSHRTPGSLDPYACRPYLCVSRPSEGSDTKTVGQFKEGSRDNLAGH